MAGTSWPTLAAGRKAKASEVELKFDWIEGHLVPMTGGNMTTSVYDLGTSTAQWRNAWISDFCYVGNTDVKFLALSAHLW